MQPRESLGVQVESQRVVNWQRAKEAKAEEPEPEPIARAKNQSQEPEPELESQSESQEPESRELQEPGMKWCLNPLFLCKTVELSQ